MNASEPGKSAATLGEKMRREKTGKAGPSWPSYSGWPLNALVTKCTLVSHLQGPV